MKNEYHNERRSEKDALRPPHRHMLLRLGDKRSKVNPAPLEDGENLLLYDTRGVKYNERRKIYDKKPLQTW